MLLLTKINIHHCKNDKNILWSCCIIMGLQELQIIPCWWNIWHPHVNKEQNLLWKTNTIIWHSLWLYLPRSIKLKLLNINIIQGKYVISIDQTDHIIKNIIQEYWVTKTKYEVKLQKSPFPVDASFEHTLFVGTLIIGEELKEIDKSHVGSLNHWVGGLV